MLVKKFCFERKDPIYAKKSQNLNVFLKQPSKHFIAAIVSPTKRHISRRFEFKSWWLYM